MADTTNPPPSTTEEFELPPSADVAAQNNKEVSWSATPEEIDNETIEKLKKQVTYEIDATMSVKVVLTDTFNQFKATDPKLLFVSATDSSMIIRTANDLEKISAEAFPTLFPATVANGKTWMTLFFVSELAIGKLKRTSFGFYQYSAKKIWIQESSTFNSNNVRKIGFFIHKDPRRSNRDHFAKDLFATLSTHPLNAEVSGLFHEAKEAQPFDGPIPQFRLRLANRIQHGNSTTNTIFTSGIMVQCDFQHVTFLTRLFTSYFEDGSHPEQFVPYSLLYGDDPSNHRAYRNAILSQNKFLSEARALPVIGISPKALKETITIGSETEPQTVLTILNRYSYFTSIEATPQSDTIGKYFFMTTVTKFEKAKLFIINTLPQIWSKLSNNFLDELPPSVNCPRLTTSNLTDASTIRTAKLLATTPLPDDSTVISKWSKPPQIRQQPPRAVTVNYTEANFPSMTKASQEKRAQRSPSIAQHSTPTGPPLESTSVHSHASATSGGTTFTREDGISLFTSMTESIMDDMKSQVKAQRDDMLEMMRLNQVNQAAQIAHNIKSDERNTKSDERIEKLLQALALGQLTTEAPSTRNNHTEHNRQTASPSPPPSHTKQTHVTESSSDRPMDTTTDQSNTTDPVQRPMDTATSDDDNSNEQTNQVATTAPTDPTHRSDNQETGYGTASDTAADPYAHGPVDEIDSFSSPSLPGSPRSGSQSSSNSRTLGSSGGRGGGNGGGRGRGRMVTQTPASLAKSPWKANQDNVAYDDQAVETFEGGNGEDDVYEWTEDESVAPGSQATVLDDGHCSVATIPSDISPNKSPTTPTTNPSSQPLPWSPDADQILPWSPDPTAPPSEHNQIDPQPHSPPKLARVIPPKTPTVSLSGLARINASRDSMVVQIVDSLARQKASEVDTTEATPDSAAPTSPTTANHRKSDHRDTVEEWHTIFQGSASKRKAKASPKTNITSLIRKPETRSLKKQLFEPAPPHQGAPASKN